MKLKLYSFFPPSRQYTCIFLENEIMPPSNFANHEKNRFLSIISKCYTTKYQIYMLFTRNTN